jgi:hypothetical protein
LEAIKNIVEQPAGSMDAVYNRIFVQLSRLSPGDREVTRHIFMWMAYSFRLLNLADLVIAHGFDWKTYQSTQPQEELLDDFLLVCGNLVVVDELGYVQFIHKSVPDYIRKQSKEGESVFTVETEHFRSYFVQEDQAHAEIGLTCLMCMDINMYKTLELSARDNTTRTVAQPEDFTSHLSANPFQ